MLVIFAADLSLLVIGVVVDVAVFNYPICPTHLLYIILPTADDDSEEGRATKKTKRRGKECSKTSRKGLCSRWPPCRSCFRRKQQFISQTPITQNGIQTWPGAWSVITSAVFIIRCVLLLRFSDLFFFSYVVCPIEYISSCHTMLYLVCSYLI